MMSNQGGVKGDEETDAQAHSSAPIVPRPLFRNK